jgi:hypothetical protein
MANAYSLDDLLDFLAHAADRGMMPAATASALAVAARNVFGVLANEERKDLSRISVAEVVKRFTNKRAKEFSSSSLKEYGRRVQRAVELFKEWRENPADFSPKTRATKRSGGKGKESSPPDDLPLPNTHAAPPAHATGGYSSSFPIRADWVVTVTNIPSDLRAAEAERLAKFVRMLAFD